ncbi:hypothetical protein Tco_0571884, partial [Tanacetum coccineum]
PTSEDEDDFPAENSSKQGRMIEDIDLDVSTSLVQERQLEDDTFIWEETFPLPSDAAKKVNLTERDESIAFVTPTKTNAL